MFILDAWLGTVVYQLGFTVVIYGTGPDEDLLQYGSSRPDGDSTDSSFPHCIAPAQIVRNKFGVVCVRSEEEIS